MGKDSSAFIWCSMGERAWPILAPCAQWLGPALSWPFVVGVQSSMPQTERNSGNRSRATREILPKGDAHSGATFRLNNSTARDGEKRGEAMANSRFAPMAVIVRGLIGMFAYGGYCTTTPGAEPEQTEVPAPPVEVISTTPLPGLEVPRDSVPANVQTGNAQDLRDPATKTLPSLMERTFDSVNINQAQGNPYQPDLNFRGFAASPLLGTAPGLSVFQDGVRVNEPFGDSVNWDLIPNSAISTITLIPGSNAIFGLNTLGGALAITTKDGFSFPGIEAEGYGGSFGRTAADIEYGGSSDRLGYFLTGNAFDEQGWRD